MDRIKGSLELLSDIQLKADMEGLDAESKTLLRNKEVLAVILQGVVEEYAGYSLKDIMGFIGPVNGDQEVSPGRTNSQIRGENAETIHLNEKTSYFDMAFRAKDPRCSDGDVQVSLHIDIEMQKRYKMPYPIEKRGMYYLPRRLSSQLSLATEDTDYDQLEKCYSIWICRDRIPKDSRYSISFYRVTNTQTIGAGMVPKEHYDLMTLVVIKLGHKVYNGRKGEDGYSLLRFLNAILYPHRNDFMETITEYVDLSENEDLRKEAEQVNGLGLSILEEGIQALITDNLEEKIPRERIIAKLCRHFHLTQESAEQYYEQFAVEV